MNALTDNQFDTLEFMIKYFKKNHRPPSRQRICDEFGWSSPNAAEDVLKALYRKHYLGRGEDGHYKFMPISLFMDARMTRTREQLCK